MKHLFSRATLMVARPGISMRLILTMLATVGLLAFGQGQSKLGPFVVQPRSANPLHPPLVFPAQPTPQLVDLDNDGDLDLVAGASYQGFGDAIRYYKNIGTSTSPRFDEQTSWDNPFYYEIYNYLHPYVAIAPTLGDLDNDGDLDLLVGFNSGALRYYKNTGGLEFEEQTTAWNPATKSGNPFLSIFAGYYSSPHFVDYDHDGDQDVLLGTNATTPYNATVHLYVNDGTGNFTHQPVPGVNPVATQIAVTTVDYNNDGDLDIITGEESGLFRYFDNNGSFVFTEQVGWDALNSLALGTFTAPTFADLTGDGKFEVITAGTTGGQSLAFLQNNGDNTFVRRRGIHDPFGGVDVRTQATPLFTDVDLDGDLDMLSGNNNGFISYYQNDNGIFNEVTGAANPFSGIVTGSYFSLSYVDLNGDGFRDVVGASSSGLQYFKSNSGASFSQVAVGSGPFASITTLGDSKSEFADINGDGDYDLLLSDEIADDPGTTATEWGFRMRYFENTGNPTIAVFTERTGSANPFASIREEYNLYPRLFDIDHDGDLDALIGEGGDIHIESPESNEFLYFENTGSATAFNFVYRGDVVEQYDNAEYFSPAFIDYDNDGDTDIFEGDAQGWMYYYKNTNPAPVLTISTTTTSTGSMTGAVYVDAGLTVTDADNDSISQVTVQMGNFSLTDTLTFVRPAVIPDPNLTAHFSDDAGTLTIRGKASVAYYQALLRSLRFHFDESASSGRLRSGARTASASISKTISIQVLDADQTNTAFITKTFSISTSTNNTPTFSNGTLHVVAGKTASLNLASLFADADGIADLDEATLKVSAQPASGAAATISSGSLMVNYAGVAFSGIETLVCEICDLQGACAQNTVTITVTNTAPVFANANSTLIYGSEFTLDTQPLISDADDNIVPSSLKILSNPPSGAQAILAGSHVSVNYANVIFAGTESLTLEICDVAGACAQSIITINVTNTAPSLQNSVLSTTYRKTATLGLGALMADADNNMDASSLKILSGPASGALASISGSTLSVDYSGTSFLGTEEIQLEVCDLIGACAQGTVTVTVVNAAPLFQSVQQSLPFGGKLHLTLNTLLSDADANIDAGSLRITGFPASGAPVSIDSDGKLTVDYSGTNFAGIESIEVEVCDLALACARATIEITVSNAPPAIAAATLNTQENGSVMLDLLSVTSDVDNNLDAATFEIVTQPISEASARIADGKLMLDYSGVSFTGHDRLRIRVCDVAGACDERDITIFVQTLERPIEIFNAVAPNGAANNKWLRIANIPSANRVTIYNRWGDVVFDVEGYDNEVASRRFEGHSSAGRELATGTYFYKIELPSIQKTLTGYLTLVR